MAGSTLVISDTWTKTGISISSTASRIWCGAGMRIFPRRKSNECSNSHSQIAESAVIAVPDAIRGEEVKAYIVLKSPLMADTLMPQEIWEYCKPHLAAFKVPRYIEYCDELPKTPSSKVQKNLLREQSKLPGARVFDRLAQEVNIHPLS